MNNDIKQEIDIHFQSPRRENVKTEFLCSPAILPKSIPEKIVQWFSPNICDHPNLCAFLTLKFVQQSVLISRENIFSVFVTDQDLQRFHYVHIFYVCLREVFGVRRGAPTDWVSRGPPTDRVRRGASMGGVRRSAPTDWGKNISITPPPRSVVHSGIRFSKCTIKISVPLTMHHIT